jgi:ubiquinone/menaquinone biosynthesis C-methylase UbiE
LDTEQIKLKREAVVERFGPWTSHNMHLKEEEYTFEHDDPNFEDHLQSRGRHLQRIVQIAADVLDRPLSSLRVLDLACLEGLYGIEFARQGAEVVGIEVREPNIEKARFAAEALSLENITFVQDDVRNLSMEKYGQFDVVLCLGILYHLDAPDVFHFMERISEVCTRLLIIDTHVSATAEISHTFKGQEYHGRPYVEHAEGVTDEEKLKLLWASLDNEKSFWFTPPSLFNLLYNTGFTSAYACLAPAVLVWPILDRHTLVAIKGQPLKMVCAPTAPDQLWSEESYLGFRPAPAAAVEQSPTPAPAGVRSKLRSAIKRIVR